MMKTAKLVVAAALCCSACSAEDAGVSRVEADESWDDMEPQERAEAALPHIESQLAQLEAGEVSNVGRAVTQVASSLSSVRAELWMTLEGQRRYKELEQRLEAVTPRE